MRQTVTSLFIILALSVSSNVIAQNTRPLTMEEYELAKTFTVEDLDNDTYVKFDNSYILDRYEMRKPVFITGDDGKRKRVDLYKLIARQDLSDLGLMVFYTTETGSLYTVLVPGFESSGEIWEQYFEDIHAIDKIEDNFVLKLSYVLSREFSYQMRKAGGAEELTTEHATYGSDICFPGDQLVSMADGSYKMLADVKSGDRIVTLDPDTRTKTESRVKKVTSHTPSNYAITELTLLLDERRETEQTIELELTIKLLKATPNHPMMTLRGNKEIGDVEVGEEILAKVKTGNYELFTVINSREITEGTQSVYSLETEDGAPIEMNSVIVKQKN